MKYFNYHCHSYYTNPVIFDSPTSPKDYINRIKELGHSAYSSVEHGISFNWVEKYLLCKEHNIKFIYGVEAYIEHSEKRYHIIMTAKNKDGLIEINKCINNAVYDNFKYNRPCITLDMIKTHINPKNVFITTACIAGILRDSTLELFKSLYNHFKDDMLLEVQPHIVEEQIEANKKARELSKEYGLKLIGGNDSHYIHSKDRVKRDNLILVKGVNYSDDSNEEGWFMDYPDYDTMFARFMKQGIWTENEVRQIIDNTNILSNVEDIILDTNWKIPSLYKGMTKKEKLNKYLEVVNEYCSDYLKGMSSDEIEKCKREIKYEIEEVVKGDIIDYQPTVSAIVNRAKSKGGIITKTGRGSSSSWFTNKIFGFTSVDRFTSKVPLLMERFMTADKVLLNHEMMDIDNNIYGIEKFVEAQEEILGKNCSAPIIAYGTLKAKSAFKLMCSTRDDIPVSLQNEMSSKIDEYQQDYNYADDDEKENIRLEDYMDNAELVKLYNESKSYLGIVSDIKKHASAYCIADHDIVSLFGVVKTKGGDIVLNLEGTQMDTLGYVKIDWLQVDVVGLIDTIYKEIGIPTPTTDELYKLVENDKATWDIYANGFTMCVNQVEKPKTREKVMRYKPQTVEELCAFISAVRPSFQTYYKRFEKREHFEFGLKILDDLLQGKFLDSSWILYQESIMLIVLWLNFEKRESAKLMKAISKKKAGLIEMIEDRFTKACVDEFLKANYDEETAREKTKSIWEVIENASAYGFNASHALCMAFDSLYVAYAKAHYPKQTFYAMIKFYILKEEKKVDKISKILFEASSYGLKVLPYRFRQDNRNINMNGDIITQSLFTIKRTDANTANTLYELRHFQGNFIELLNEMKNRGLRADIIKSLIYINYFEEFGKIGKLIWIMNNYKELSQGRYANLRKNYDAMAHELNISYEDLIKELQNKSKQFTDKTITFNNRDDYFQTLYEHCNVDDISILEKVYREVKVLEYAVSASNDKVMKVVRYNPEKKSLLLQSCSESKERWYRLKNTNMSFKKNDIIYLNNVEIQKYNFTKNGERIERESYIINSVYNLTSLFEK